jgi:hypothetical protein
MSRIDSPRDGISGGILPPDENGEDLGLCWRKNSATPRAWRSRGNPQPGGDELHDAFLVQVEKAASVFFDSPGEIMEIQHGVEVIGMCARAWKRSRGTPRHRIAAKTGNGCENARADPIHGCESVDDLEKQIRATLGFP